MDGPASQLSPNDVGIDPRPWLYEIMLNGHIDSATFDWLSGWLDRLEFAARMLSPRRFCHGDVNAGNIMVHSETRHYLALLDWGGASWGDATWDFVPVSLSVVPVMLEGYRAVAPLDNNATAEARILWHHVQFAVFGLWKQQQRGQRWAHQQVERLKTNMQGFLALPTTQWIANLR
jgi:aminoglycoside phosphotransferase (APT) family kinase protein